MTVFCGMKLRIGSTKSVDMDVSANITDTHPPGPAGQRKRPHHSPVSRLTEEDWIELYTSRILKVWCHQEAPLGLAWAYAKCIRKDLSGYYRQPLMRAFIEETY